jgi:quinol-cytochrome oxidoreductase complex cytochrome b subunit
VRRPLHATKRLPLLFSCSPSSQSSPIPHTTVFAADADSFNGMNFTDVLIVRDLQLGFVFFSVWCICFTFHPFLQLLHPINLQIKKMKK